jgi:hypothetical protein
MAGKGTRVGESHKRHHDHRGRLCVVSLEWFVVGGELKPTKVTIEAAAGVDASMLHRLPLTTIADEARGDMAKLWERHAERPELSEADRKRVRRVLAAARAPAADPDLLEVVATTYRQATRATRAPTKAVHEELMRRGHELSRQQVGKLVMRCREIGLLGPAEPRRAGEQKTRRTK